MKKFFAIAAVAMMALTANAQIYVGGGLGFSTSTAEYRDVEGAKAPDALTEFSINPEIGYNLSENSAVGIQLGLGFGSQGDVSTTSFSIAPYYRYIFAKVDNLSFFADGMISFGSSKKSVDEEEGGVKYTVDQTRTTFGIGVQPGVAYAVNDKFSLVAKLGWFGYNNWKPEISSGNAKVSYKAGSKFGLDVDNAISFGLFYNF